MSPAPHEPFVGRERELSVLLDAARAAHGGRGALCFLSGEPGIGKTRLAEEAAQHAEQAGANVVWGSAWDGGGAPAYWPWIQVLRALRGKIGEPPEALRRDLGPLWSEDARLPEEELELREFRRHDALRSLLASASETAPLVVVLDDLHAADRGTLTALHFVARALRTLRVLVLATHRDAEAHMRPEIGALLDRIARDGFCLPLGRLREEDVVALTSGFDPLTREEATRIYRTSGGNPFFAKEVLRLVRSGAGAAKIPEAVRSVVGERVRKLAPAGLTALQALAVVGREAACDVVAHVLGISKRELDGALGEALRAAVIERRAGDQLFFSHPLFRECVYDGVPLGERARLHLRAADALHHFASTTRGHAESAARHLLLALPEGDAQHAIAEARAAARGCSRELAFDRAVELLEGALSALASTRDDWLRSEIELDLAEALVLVGEGERSREICVRVAERARAQGDASQLARAALVHGCEIRVAVVDPVQIGLLESALTLLGSDAPALRAKVLARLAGARQPDQIDPQRPVEQAFEAIALARTLDDAEVLLHTLHTGGAALTGYAPPARRRAVSRELAHLAMARGDLLLARRGYVRLSIDAAELGDAEEMNYAIKAEERLGRTLGHARFRWQSALLASMRALIEGRWADSDRAVSEASAYVAELDDEQATATLEIHRMCALRAKMRPPSEAPPTPEASSFRDQQLDWLMQRIALASVHARLGDAALARDILQRMLPLPEFLSMIPAALVSVAEAVVRAEHSELARTYLPHLQALPFPAVTWGASAFAWEGFTSDLIGRAQGLLGEFDASGRSLDSAIHAADLFGARPAALESRIALATTLLRRRATGDRERALGLLAAAHAAATELEMTGSLTRIAALHHEFGAASATRAPEFSLTREGEVWCVTSQGRSIRYKHSRAFEILKELIDHPGREYHVLELGSRTDDDSRIDAGDAGEVIDTKAMLAYRTRSQELESELAEAQRWNDSARRERLEAELEFLQDELRRGVALANQPRRTTGAAERARINVHKRLKGAIGRISSDLPELGHQLEASITTGIYVVYRPH